MTGRSRAAERTVVGVSDHAGWAVLVVATSTGRFISRARIELVDEGLPPMPHHQEAQMLPAKDGVALVERVRESAERKAREALAGIDAEGIALRACPPLPPNH